MISGTSTISSYQDQDLRVNLTCLCHTNPFIILLRLLHRGVKVLGRDYFFIYWLTATHKLSFDKVNLLGSKTTFGAVGERSNYSNAMPC